MNDRLGRTLRRLPPGTRRQLRALAEEGERRAKRVRPVSWGDLDRPRPFSDVYGADRGTPVDRALIHRFLRTHAGLIHGRVLEVGSDQYASRLGGDAVTAVDVLDIDATNGSATIMADLDEPGSLPHDRFDAAICTQTLQYLRGPTVGAAALLGSLAPGGHLLVTVPCAVARIDPSAPAADRWRFTPASLREILQAAGGEVVDAVPLGGFRAGVAFWYGLAAEELPADALTEDDRSFPILAAGVVRRC